MLSTIPRQGLFYSTAMHFAGFDLGDETAQIGIPTFCKDGLRWIQDKTGASNLFEDVCQARGLHYQKIQPALNNPNNVMLMPSKAVADLCLQVFSTSDLRRVFPLVNINAFKGTISEAYDFGRRSVSLRAQACVQAFAAVLALLEPERISISTSEAEIYSCAAEGSLVEVLAQPSIEGLQASLMLVCHRSKISIDSYVSKLTRCSVCTMISQEQYDLQRLAWQWPCNVFTALGAM
jgi:hypothetical protein